VITPSVLVLERSSDDVHYKTCKGLRYSEGSNTARFGLKEAEPGRGEAGGSTS